MRSGLLVFRVLVLALFFAMPASSQSLGLSDFSIMPQRISSISVQKSSEWEALLITFDFQIAKDAVPIVTDTTVELLISGGPEYSSVFQTAKSTFARGVAWSDGRLYVYLHRGRKPAVMIMKSRLLLQEEIAPGKLESWKATPTSLSSSIYYLPSYEPLSNRVIDFANRLEKKPITDPTVQQTIQVKRQDASYLVTEEIASLFPTPHDGKPLEALEFGDRLKVLDRAPPFYKVRFNNREGYIYQRDVVQEAELTTAQKDKLRRLGKETPGGVDSVAAKFGWRDSDKIIYSSYGYRDPFVEVKGFDSAGINIDNLALVGVIFENEMPMALFSDNKVKGQSYTLFEGDTVKNGKVLKISKTDVLFLLQEYGVSRRHKVSLPEKAGVSLNEKTGGSRR